MDISNVTFEPGCRNNWHIHHGCQQILVCVGSEGRGLSRELLDLCDGEVIIPMRGAAESLNAAVAAAILMWEMCRGERS